MNQETYIIAGLGSVYGTNYDQLKSDLQKKYSKVDILEYDNYIMTFKYYISTINKDKYINLLNLCRENKLSLIFCEDNMIRMSKQQDTTSIDIVVTPVYLNVQSLQNKNIKLTQADVNCITLAQEFLQTII